jgi:glycosyltransferase involved in cell wall biosynthesis
MFLEIVKRVKEIRPETTVVMIGEGVLDDMVKSLAGKLGLLDTIKFTGFVRNPFEYVKQSKLLVMTSLYEGHCLAVTEAMSLGIPVIAGRVPGLKDEIDDSCGILCDDYKDSFCKAILQLLDNTELYREKSEGAIERVQKYGDIDLFVSSIEKVCIEAGEENSR